jgi:hypothetical protein
VSSRRSIVALASATVLGVSLVSAPAFGQSPKPAKLKIVGSLTLQPGKWVRDDQRFKPLSRALAPGTEVRLANKAKTEDPHTLSLVKRSDLPMAPEEVFACEACGAFFPAHGVDEATGEIANPVVNVGAPGFDQPGDSIFIPPGGTVRFDVTASARTNLYYLCAIHPWMQGKFRVR